MGIDPSGMIDLDWGIVSDTTWGLVGGTIGFVIGGGGGAAGGTLVAPGPGTLAGAGTGAYVGTGVGLAAGIGFSRWLRGADSLPLMSSSGGPPPSYQPGRQAGATGSGAEFERECESKFGGNKGFRLDGRDFDGRAGKLWYDAKSSWEIFRLKPEKLAEFKSSMGQRAKIASQNGRRFGILSKGPIPTDISEWLYGKGILFKEY